MIHSLGIQPPRKTGVSTHRWQARLTAVGLLLLALQCLAQEPEIVVGTNRYSTYRTDLSPGSGVYLDADPDGSTPVRAMQRCLGYREVDYKSIVYPTLRFEPVTPSTNGTVVTYDYTAQAGRTNLVGYWSAKDVPVIIGSDGNPYIADGHHTTAGYLEPASPVRELVPGRKRVILGHVLGNYRAPAAAPQPPSDLWWVERAAHNEALLYGPEGDQLTQPTEPGYSSLQPILPSSLAMPASPSRLGSHPMTQSAYRGLAWGMVDGVVLSALDGAGKKITGFKKTVPGGTADIFFVEFFWGDFLRRRVVWDDSLAGSPLGASRADANVIAAPLSFFTAVANGIALARSETYQDQHGRRLIDYTNSALFSPNTVAWAMGSLSNGLAASTNTYHLYLRDDSTIVGPIQPSNLSTNILHIDTVVGMTPTQSLHHIRSILVNAGGFLKTSWRDTTVTNSTLRLPAGTGIVTVVGTHMTAANTLLGGGTLVVQGTLRSGLSATNGVLSGSGIIEGDTRISGTAMLAPSGPIGNLTLRGKLTLGGTTRMRANKAPGSLSADRVKGITTLSYGGKLRLQVTGEPLVEGDTLRLFDAEHYRGSFTKLDLPALSAELSWDATHLPLDGTLAIVRRAAP